MDDRLLQQHEEARPRRARHVLMGQYRDDAGIRARRRAVHAEHPPARDRRRDESRMQQALDLRLARIAGRPPHLELGLEAPRRAIAG